MNNFIYILRDPITNLPRYVGKTKNLKRRIKDHIVAPCSEGLRKWIESLSEVGKKPLIEKIEDCEGDSWVEREAFWVEHYRSKYPELLNVRAGGASPLDSDYTQEVRAFMSLKAKARFSTTEARKQNSARQSTPEAKAATSLRSKSLMSRPEARAKVSKRMKEYYASPKARADSAARAKKQWACAEARAAVSERMKRINGTPEARKAISLRMKAMNGTPEARLAISNRLKARWALIKASTNFPRAKQTTKTT